MYFNLFFYPNYHICFQSFRAKFDAWINSFLFCTEFIVMQDEYNISLYEVQEVVIFTNVNKSSNHY